MAIFAEDKDTENECINDRYTVVKSDNLTNTALYRANGAR